MTGRSIGGLPLRRLLMAALAAAAIFAYWTLTAENGGRHAVRDTAWAEPSAAGVGFADGRRLEEHYEKHGAEFGHISKQDYLRQAQLLRDAKAGGPVLETVRADKVTTRYDRETGAFIAFNPDGTIRTFFKPNDGERYYHRQASRVGE
jgi:pyocin large subunit-like protein